MQSGSSSGEGSRSHNCKRPDWELAVETELVRRNLDECMKGSHEPRPVMPAIYPSSTFVLEDSKEGEVLCGNKAKVTASFLVAGDRWASHLIILQKKIRNRVRHVVENKAVVG